MNALLTSLRGLGPVRLAVLAGVGLGTLALIAFVTMRMSAQPLGLLYSELDLKDSAQVVQKLESLNVPYELRGDGTRILVPADQVARLRLQMAEAGVPRGGSVGYELFDRSEALGTSNFTQNVNHVRALEGELSRTIAALGPVQAARVHLVLPKRELFSRDRQEATASVVLRLRGAERLGKSQIAAVQHLVAAAVPGLKPTRIAIVDQQGNILSAISDDGASGVSSSVEDLRNGRERDLVRRVQEIIERSVGPGKVRVEVRADMDFDRVTTTTESYDPNGQVPRSTQSVSESSDSSEAGDQPVTVANNLPDAQANKGAAGGPRSKTSRTEETTNYEITKTLTSHVREGGSVRRLSVAVLVDGTYSVGADGQRVYEPRSAEELKQLTALARSAIGIDTARGDTLEVINLRFAKPDDDIIVPAADLIFGFPKEEVLQLAQTAIMGVVALLALLLIVRPVLMRALAAPAGKAALAGPGGDVRLLADQSGAIAGALPAPAGSTFDNDDEVDALEQMIDINQVEGRVRASSLKKIGEIVEKHPEEAVAILRNWMYQGA